MNTFTGRYKMSYCLYQWCKLALENGIIAEPTWFRAIDRVSLPTHPLATHEFKKKKIVYPEDRLRIRYYKAWIKIPFCYLFSYFFLNVIDFFIQLANEFQSSTLLCNCCCCCCFFYLWCVVSQKNDDESHLTKGWVLLFYTFAFVRNGHFLHLLFCSKIKKESYNKKIVGTK